MAPHEIKTVAVVATGVIGSSFIALFLARGLRVLVVSTSADAETKVKSYLERVWPTLDPAILVSGASVENCVFVGKSLEGHWDEVDFVQEVSTNRSSHLPKQSDVPMRRSLGETGGD